MKNKIHGEKLLFCYDKHNETKLVVRMFILFYFIFINFTARDEIKFQFDNKDNS